MEEKIIRNIIDKEEYFEVQLENPDLSLTCHKFKKGQGWEEEVTFNGVTKPRWLIHIEEIYKKRAETSKKKVNTNKWKNLIGKRFKNGKLQN